MKKLYYYISCFAMYTLLALSVVFIPYPLDENQAMFKIMGVAAAGVYFITKIVRNYLMHLFDIDRDFIYEVNTLKNTIINVILLIPGFIVQYLVFKVRNIAPDYELLLPIIYIIFAYVSIWIASRKNREARLFDIIAKRKDWVKYLIICLIFSVIWLVPVLIGEIVFSFNKSNIGSDTNIALLVLPHIYALVVSYIFSVVNYNFLSKQDHSRAYSETGRMGYEMFIMVFYLIYYITMCVIKIFIIKNTSSDVVLGQMFMITGMVMLLVSWFNFDGYIGGGSSNNSTNKDSSKKDKFRLTFLSDGRTAFTYDIDDKMSVTSIKDKNGKETRYTDIDITDDIKYVSVDKK